MAQAHLSFVKNLTQYN